MANLQVKYTIAIGPIYAFVVVTTLSVIDWNQSDTIVATTYQRAQT